MPLPTPSGESQQEFISRCMSELKGSSPTKTKDWRYATHNGGANDPSFFAKRFGGLIISTIFVETN